MKRLALVFSLSVLILSLPAMTHLAQAANQLVSPTGTDSPDCSVNPCQHFSAAIALALPGDTVTAVAGNYSELSFPINITKDLTINGAGQTTTFIDAAGSPGPIFQVSGSTAGVTVTNLTVENGAGTDGCGGGIEVGSNGILTLKNVTVLKNSAITHGGGICNGGILTLDASSVTGNFTEVSGACAGNGGGIMNTRGATLNITNNSIIEGNIANQGPMCAFLNDGNGGGIFNQTGTLLIDHSQINDNQAMSPAVAIAVGGGGIYNQGGDVTIQNGSIIDGNFALDGSTSSPSSGGDGGGIYHTSGLCGANCPVQSNLDISNTTISGNTAFFDGGGIYRDNPMTLTNVTISGNQALQGEGGALYNNGGIVTSCQLFQRPCIGTLINVTIAENQAFDVGGVSADNTDIPTILKNTLLSQNTQTSDNTVANCDPAATALSSQNHNLSDDANCSAFFTGADDLNNQSAGIGPLANNGGLYASNPPFTHALLPTSVAVDAIPPADCSPLTEDERKFPRPGVGFGPNCDIGAFELQVLPSPSPIPIPSPVLPPLFLEGSGVSCALNPFAMPIRWGVLAAIFAVPLALRFLLRKRDL